MARIKTLRIWLLAAILIIADQTIKLVIRDNFLQLHFDIVGGLLYFQPLHNTKLSWINSLLGTNVGFLPHVISNSLILILLVWGFRYARSIRTIPVSVEYSYIFILAGAICSIIDKLFWGGSLDFIGLMNWFIFDTKDLFITIGITIFAVYAIVYSFKHPKAVNGSTKDDIRMIRDFFGFIIEDSRRLYGKIIRRHVK